jgi:hypothetical protein
MEADLPLQASKSKQFRASKTSSSAPAPEGGNRAGEAIKVQENPWLWVVAAFCVALGLAISVVTEFGANGDGFRIALQATARLNFLLFWPAYAGGALTTLFGNVFLPLRNNLRNFGLAFAAALIVHLGLVAFLCASGNAPDAKTFIVFGTAAAFVYLLAFLSIPGMRRMVPDRFGRLIRTLAINYIALAFLKDFVRPTIGSLHEILLYGTANSKAFVMYVPFSVLAILGPMLRLAAWIQKSTQQQARKWPVRQPSSY